MELCRATDTAGGGKSAGLRAGLGSFREPQGGWKEEGGEEELRRSQSYCEIRS